MSNRHDDRSFAALDGVRFPEFEPGTVWLVGAGPGAPGLLTLLGYHALTRADAVVYDALVGIEILDWVPQGTILEYAGKRGGKPSAHQSDISTRLVELARAGKRVLRLKGGDPFMFGRGGEECQTLAAAGVAFRIVPGITAGIGGVGYVGIPVTHRDTNHSVLFLTGHDSSGTVPAGVNWSAVATAAPVLVMYMAVKNLPDIAARLIDGGRAPSDAVAIVSHATLPEQKVVDSTLGEVGALAESGTLTTPAIVVVGPTVSLRQDVGRYVERMGVGRVG